MTEHLHELPETSAPTRDSALSECFARLDAIGLSFASNEQRAGTLIRLLAEQGFGIYPSIPMPRTIL